MQVNYLTSQKRSHASRDVISNVKNYTLQTILFFVSCLLLTIVPTNAHAAEYTVSSASAFNSLASSLTGGDVVTWTDGTYTDQNITFYATGGTVTNPIILKAETPGGVVFNGSSEVNFYGSYLIMDGFFWKNGEGTSDHVEFRKSGSSTLFAENCTIRNCAFDDLYTVEPTKSRWIVLHGYNNVVENCSFVNKKSAGALILVELSYQDLSKTAGHIIRNNYFYNITAKDAFSTNTGDCEAIRVGVSTNQANDAGVLVEGNYFQEANGENEIITNKSTNNIYKHNTFRSCRGSLVLRHGANALVDGNFFLGEGKASSGGIRVTDSRHTIINNYMQGLSNDGDSWNNGITLVGGSATSGGTSNDYQKVDDILIAFNTIYNSDDPIYYNDRAAYDPTGIIAYNSVYSTNGTIIAGDISGTGQGMSYIGNIFGGSTIGITNSGITEANAQFSANGEIYKPSSSSVVANAAGSTYSTTAKTDVEGFTRPSSNMDVGAFEVSGASGSVVYAPITNSDVSNSVGASFLDASGTLTSGGGTTVNVTGVTTTTSTATISVGKTTTLSTTIAPSNATTKTVSYSSNKESVATVNSSGIVTGVSPGSATITVKTTDGNFTATSNITVEASSQSTLVPSDLMRNPKQWKITYPDGVEDKTLTGEPNNEYFYATDDSAIVFFVPIRSDNGSTPNSSYIRSELRERTEDGSADMYWTTTGRHMLYVEQAITHLPLVKPHLVATQIHGNKADGIDDAMVMRLENQHLFLSFNGGKLRSDFTIKTDYVLGTKHEVIFDVIDGKHYVYYSEDGKLLTAYNSGDASAYLVKDGTNDYVMDLNYDQSYFKVGNYTQSNADKEGSSTDDPANYGEVKVYDFLVQHGATGPVAVTGVNFLPSTARVAIDGTTLLSTEISPSNATDKGVTYSSSNKSIATVSSTGLVTGISAGTATITVTTDDGSFTATSKITVQDIPTGLTNVALNKTVTATTTTDTGSPETSLVDGSTDTKIALSGFPQTITIDLGALYDISYSELVFYQDRAYQYKISVATTENGPYTEVADRSTNTTAGTVTNPITDYFTTTAQFIQITVTGADAYTGTWISILEFRALGKLTDVTSIKSGSFTSNEALNVYPNPVRTEFTIELPDAKETAYKVFNSNGKVVLSGKINNTTSRIDASNLPTGTYMVQVEKNTKIIYKIEK